MDNEAIAIAKAGAVLMFTLFTWTIIFMTVHFIMFQ